jgi:hypothetical protein
MKHAVTAAIALALGVGLAAAAQANQINPQDTTAAMHKQAAIWQQHLQRVGTMQHRQIRQAHRTQRATAHAQQQNAMHRTLQRQNLGRLPGNQGVGIGSSTPTPGPNMTPKPNAGNAGTPIMPPTNSAAAGAGGSTGTPNPMPSGQTTK